MDISAKEIIIQTLGALGILASVISFQCKKHKFILFFRTANEALFAIQFFLLGAYTGVAMNLVGCLRNQIFSNQVEGNRNTVKSVTFFGTLFLVFGLMTWQGPKSLLIICAKILSTIAYGNKNTTFVRTAVLITSTSWLIYDYCVFSVTGMICEALTLISIIAGIIRLDIIPFTKKIIAK